jgi:hypothetical protein
MRQWKKKGEISQQLFQIVEQIEVFRKLKKGKFILPPEDCKMKHFTAVINYVL